MIRMMLLVTAAAAVLSGQTLTNLSLRGKYYFRHMQFTAATARTAHGAMTFDGNGALTFTARQTIGTQAAVPLTGTGTYSVDPAGSVRMSNPQQSGRTVNARLGEILLVGSTTEGSPAVFDLFAAVPAPASPVENILLNGDYWIASLGFPGGSTAAVRNTLFRVRANGFGGMGDVTVRGHAANLGGQTILQTVAGAVYALLADGSGTITFPLAPGVTVIGQLVSGGKTTYVSQDGSAFLAGSDDHEFIAGMKARDFTQDERIYTARLRFGSEMNTAAGSRVTVRSNRLIISERVRTPAGLVNFTGSQVYSGSFPWLGAAEEGAYELLIGSRLRPLPGTGVFLFPHGVLNTASFAPVGAPVAAGTFLALFGSNLSATTEVARSLPFPPALGGVEVMVNGQRAPVYAVAPQQLSVLVPFSVTGEGATFVVVNNGVRSNAVTVPLARTSPGIFTLPPGGTGAAAVLKADFSIVSAANAARRGETVLIFLTGLGAVMPAVPDGGAASATVLSRTIELPNVYIGGVKGEVSFSGLAPGLAGLYQLNVVIPRSAPSGAAVPIGIETSDAFHDQADIAIAP